MARQNTDFEKDETQKPKISFAGLISYLVDVGGAGGLIKTGLAFLVWGYLFFQDKVDVLIWNTLILCVPCLIDVIEFKKVPPNVQSEIFSQFRGWLMILLWVAILFSVFLYGGSANIEGFNCDNIIVKYILKFFILFSVIGVGFSYAAKVYTEGDRLKRAEGPVEEPEENNKK